MKSRPSVRVILQSATSECALACLAMLSAHHGKTISLQSMRDRFGYQTRGTSFSELLNIGAALNLDGRVLKINAQQLKDLAVPCVLHWDINHFVVLEHATDKALSVVDPALGRQIVPLDEAIGRFTGISIEFSPNAEFESGGESEGLNIYKYAAPYVRRKTLVKFLLAILVSQGIALVSPLYGQILMDKILTKRDLNAFVWVPLVFGVIVLGEFVVRRVRHSWALSLSTHLNEGLSGNQLNRLLRLPLRFFENRSIGRILSYFDALTHIRQFIAADLPVVIFDFLLLTLTTIFLAKLYSPVLSLSVVAFFAAYVAYRWRKQSQYHAALRENMRRISAERDHFLETIRQIQTIKLLSMEQNRFFDWQKLFGERTASDAKMQRFQNEVDTTRTFFISLENLFSLGLAVWFAFHGAMTAGMIVGFIAYKRMFAMSCLSLVDVVCRGRNLKVSAEVLTDIAQQPEDEVYGAELQPLKPGLHKIEAKNLTYAYERGQKNVINGFSFEVCPGDRVAIVGPSGSGKTTLLKLLVGLLKPDSGEILVSGAPLRTLDRKSYLSNVAIVMQNDRLLSVSLRDNIALGDPSPDDSRISDAVELACLKSIIDELPLRLHTIISDSGVMLSAGQIQRVLIARALYKRPSVLFMDEGTANLDEATEAIILGNIRSAGITVIHATHRRQVWKDSTKIVRLVSEGQVEHGSAGSAHERERSASASS